MADCLQSVKHSRMSHSITLSPKGLTRCQPWSSPAGSVMLACMTISLQPMM